MCHKYRIQDQDTEFSNSNGTTLIFSRGVVYNRGIVGPYTCPAVVCAQSVPLVEADSLSPPLQPHAPSCQQCYQIVWYSFSPP